jgi:hypothetical protein
MAKKMWAVSRGSYSDYTVLCLLKTKAEAKTLVKRMIEAGDDMYGDPPRVEEIPVVTADVEQVDILRMQVTLWDGGGEAEASATHWTKWPFDTIWIEDAQPVHWRWVRAPCHNGRGGRLEVAGTDHERVRKVFGERKALIQTDPILRGKREVRG